MNARPLVIPRRLYRALCDELARRGRGRRESGAFLLASTRGPSNRIVDVAYYDDLDPDSLTGAISFHTIGYSALADRCARDQLTVVADVHTHPRGQVYQSDTDQAHPMVAIAGHTALIMPCYGAGQPTLRQLGVHVFGGAGRWDTTRGRASRTRIRHETFLERLRSAGAQW